MSKTQTAQTVYGDVDFETVTCASCEQEYLPEDTITLHRGVTEKKKQYGSFVAVHYKANTLEQVHFCENCKDEPTKITFTHVAIGGTAGFVVGSLIGILIFNLRLVIL
jgi:hypothetical protein